MQPTAGSSTAETAPAAFYFDLVSPLAYLAAEQVLHVLPGPVEWQPVLARELSDRVQERERKTETETERMRREEALRADVARWADELGLQRLRWPSPFPFDSTLAMRAATYAKSIGRTVGFAQAAFRQAFAGGRSLGEPDSVLIAAAACEMHPAAVLKGAELASVQAQLSAATRAAAKVGVSEVPAVRMGERVFQGESSLSDAAAHMGEAMRAAQTDATVSGAGGILPLTPPRAR